MILEELVLHNVGPFKGEHRLALESGDKRKPIVLIGGLNGAGKTTLLEALQLSLYGKLSPAGRTTGLGYEEYLRRLINRQVSASTEGASVELSFRVHEEGKLRTYRVHRSWRESSKRIKESVEVFVDGQYDSVFSDTWQERVGRFIPQQMAHLFFFDGDRIEALADMEQSARLFRTAIDTLLGVDLVDQLGSDLKALVRRVGTRRLDEGRQVLLEAQEKKSKEAKHKLEHAQLRQGELQVQHDGLSKQLAEVQKRFKAQGGELVEREAELEAQRKDAAKRSELIRSELLALAAGDLPFLLVPQLLAATVKRAQNEKKKHDQRIVRGAIQEQMEGLQAKLTKLRPSAQVMGVIEAELEEVKKAGDAQKESATLVLSPESLQRSLVLKEAQLPHLLQQAGVQRTELLRLEAQVEALDRLLAATPDQDSLAGIMREREQLRKAVHDCDVALQVHALRVEDLRAEYEQIKTQYERMHEAEQSRLVQEQDVVRMLDHSGKVTRSLRRFREQVTARHIERLQKLIFESYSDLLRKKGMVSALTIDPHTCKVSLLDESGANIPPERLSMGERQLLAVAMLWGMAKASGRKLPVIVDTPLGRLDSKHRTHLVERYYPRASHQVILLSTDEEIDGRYQKRLAPHIGQSWHIHYSDSTKSSTLEQGYFF